MKKLFCLLTIFGLSACQAPYEHNVYRYTSPRVCVEHYDAFVCKAPTQIWHETVYPKNEAMTQYAEPVYIQESFNRSVYGMYED